MKRLLSAASLLLPFLSSFAQDWHPFPAGQRSFYIYQSGNKTAGEMICKDAVEHRSGYDIHFFNRKPSDDSCFNIAALKPPTQSPPPAPPKIAQPDSVLICNDSVVVVHGQRKIVYEPDGGTAYTISLSYELVAGIMDSVKTYTSHSDTTLSFRLSKSFGIIHFYSKTSNSGVKLAGLQDNNGEHGLLPSFHSFFDLKPGDQWLYAASDWPGLQSYSYTLFKVLSVITYADSIILHLEQKRNVQGTPVVTQIDRLYRKELKYNAPPSNTHFQDKFHVLQVRYELRIDSADTLIDMIHTAGSYFVDSPYCIIYPPFEGSGYTTWRTGLGEFESGSVDVGSVTHNYLAGYMKNNKQTGNMYLGLPEMAPQYTHTIYPNPAKDLLYTAVTGTYQITDICGRELAAGTCNDIIDVSRLATGLYYIILVEPGNTSIHKFQKQLD